MLWFYSLLSPPTAEECETAMGKYKGVRFFPYALHNPYSEGLQNAVFRLEGAVSSEHGCLVLTANDSWCPFHDSWSEVMADFLTFLQAHDLSIGDITQTAFLKDRNASYMPDRVTSSHDIRRWAPCDRKKEHHPEAREGEILLYNTKSPSGNCILLRTLRIGEIAYSRSGERLSPEEGFVPVFAQLEEVLALKRVAMNRKDCDLGCAISLDS